MSRISSSGKKRIALAVIVIFFMAAFWYSGVPQCLTFECIKAKSIWLRAQVIECYWKTVCLYLLTFIAIVVCCLPGAAVMSIMAGYLFGMFFGLIYLVMGATSGAIFFFLLARYLLGSYLQARFAPRLMAFNQMVERRGWLYLLMLRCLPLVPFAVVNILAGLTRISFTTFAWTTIIGVIPTGIIFSYAGCQLGNLNSVNEIFTLPILLALVALMLVVILPMVINRYKKIF